MSTTVHNSFPIYFAPSLRNPATLVCLVSALLSGCSNSQPQSTSSKTVVISAPSQTIVAGSKEVFKATRDGALVNDGQWTVLGGSANGQISSDGTYQAPVGVPATATVNIAYVVNNKTFTYPIQILNAIPVLSGVSPSSLNGDTVTIAISGSGFTTDMAASLDGQASTTIVNSASSMTVTGFLAPWRTGTVQLSITSKSTSAVLAEESIPITPTAVSFDAAARFLTQAGFGPRPDLVEHVQKIGMAAFITEQQALPVTPYQPTDQGIITIMERAVLGSSPLQMRVAWALQSFLTRTGIFLQASNFPFEQKMETDSTGNFRNLLTDISSDASMGMFLNLMGNAASRDPSIHPNQNFGRELLQLFTVGTVMLNDDGTVQTGTDGNPIPAYSEDTVLEVSRALTGWVNGPITNPGFTFYGVDWSSPMIANESQHDEGQKQIFNTTLPAGQTAAEDRTMALDAIFAHPNVPPFVSRILIQRLVKSNPSPDYVKRIATVFENDGNGVRGNLAAIVRAILLDPEARSGDTNPSSSDGFLQEPYLFETFAMNIIGWTASDAQPTYLSCTINECIYTPSTVFGFFSPSYTIPGTNINSPEFQILNDITRINRSQLLWGMITGQQGGFPPLNPAGWLSRNFKTIPALVDALNHLAYHGQMSTEEQNFIINYCTSLQTTDPSLPAEDAVFLALNADNYTVVH